MWDSIDAIVTQLLRFPVGFGMFIMLIALPFVFLAARRMGFIDIKNVREEGTGVALKGAIKDVENAITSLKAEQAKANDESKDQLDDVIDQLRRIENILLTTKDIQLEMKGRGR